VSFPRRLFLIAALSALTLGCDAGLPSVATTSPVEKAAGETCTLCGGRGVVTTTVLLPIDNPPLSGSAGATQLHYLPQTLPCSTCSGTGRER
jgi:hypothetical protein